MRRLPAALLVSLALAIAACGGGSDDDDDPTATLPPVETAAPTAAGPSDAIRSLDLEQADAVQAFAAEIGGTYVQTNVLYADVTGDDVEDAVVPLSSGGSLGDVAFIVVTLEGETGVAEVLRHDAREFGVSVRIDDGRLVAVEPVPGPDDPFCCPSQIRTTTWVGDGGTGLTEESSVVEDNPPDGTTPGAEED
jgi:hypothetical protein